MPVRVRLNGEEVTRSVEPRLLLSDFLRHGMGLTGTHVGCEHGVCGACTILVDGEPARACLMLAVQADGREITTVEGLTPGPAPPGPDDPALHPIQRAFRDTHALQCGFCTPGILMTTAAFLAETPRPSRAEIREALSGHLCRCTGYHHIVDGVARAAELLAAGEGAS
ncbi:MAG: (2Fe-2S)-binding protein [Gemmatimonadota bacterium]|nr:(2Fe-2S)-binding protein [Gemmatimonadota bacterium]